MKPIQVKRFIWLLPYLFACQAVYCQFYLRGEVRDSRGRLLEGVRINLLSRGANPFYTGRSGTFGIPLSKATDSITCTFDGYEILHTVVDARNFQSLVLKMLPSTAQQYLHKRLSVTTNLKTPVNSFSSAGESYSSLVENGFVNALQYPETGYALHIDKASYSNMRRFLNNGMPVPKDAIRIEELLNYFRFTRHSQVNDTRSFNCYTDVSDCPWNDRNKLFFVNISAPRLDIDSLPASNLVFLVDISGSMDQPNRLPLLQSAFKLLIDNLREKDSITIVTYGGGVRIALPAAGGKEKQRIKNVIDSLSAGGDTPGAGAINIAYNLARRSFLAKGNNRVILATDGDFNVGQSSEKELEELIITFRQTGIYLTCLGVGMGNYKDSKLEALAKKGNGNFAYIDNQSEAEKVLVTELTQTLYAVANNAFVKIDFDPAVVKRYRLIGFDNKKDAMADSTSELEGGETGSGHSAMAVFEIEPAGTDSVLEEKRFADILVQYRIPGQSRNNSRSFHALYHPVRMADADSACRLAASIAMFGSVLRQSPYTKNKKLEDVQALAASCIDPGDKSQLEFLSLISKAINVYQYNNKKKAKKNRR